MKDTSKQFKSTIKAYLDKRAESDPQFATSYAKEGKSIDDCCTYILNWVQKSGCNGFADEEIFGQAVHYYDEENIEIGEAVKCDVVVNHKVELTDADIARAKAEALDKVREEQVNAIKASAPKAKAKSSKPVKEDNGLLYPSLF